MIHIQTRMNLILGRQHAINSVGRLLACVD
jgi:hypothetical protein